METEEQIRERHDELMFRYGVLRERCAELFEQLNHLEQVEGPELAARYSLEIGQFKIRIFELSVEIRRWQRRFELRQMSVNANQQPDFMAIEGELDREFSDYQFRMKEFAQTLGKAREHVGRRTLSRAESTEIRCLYLNAAKRLHPDANPSSTEQMRNLWQRVQTAYSNRRWTELRFLSTLVDVVTERPCDFPVTESGLHCLQMEVHRLENVEKEQLQKITDLKKRVPWSYFERLTHVSEVIEEQENMKKEIAALSERVEFYEKKWKGEVMA